MAKTVVGIFDSSRDAETAAHQVKDHGLRTDDISIIAKDESGQTTQTTGTFTDQTHPINDNISGGTMTGGVLGGLAGLLLGMGTMVIPGLGVIAAAGPIAGLLSGALTGGIVGGLVDLGIPEEAGRKYEADVKQGRILWSMKTQDQNVTKVTDILKSCGAKDIGVH